ncbi:hypothetical protein DFH28DRAFT_838427, partial [Melampsora americana]
SERWLSVTRPIAIPSSALAAVKAHLPQCFYCSTFGHSYHECPDINKGVERKAAHFNDWRRVRECKYMYSLDALFP